MSFKSHRARGLLAAALTLIAAPAFASPASVIPDTAHNIVRGVKQIGAGTYHGVAHQVDNVGHAARSTGHSVVRGVHHITRRHRRHHHHHHYSHHYANGGSTVGNGVVSTTHSHAESKTVQRN